MEELQGIELLREVTRGEGKVKLPLNIFQQQKPTQKIPQKSSMPPMMLEYHPNMVMFATDSMQIHPVNHISDDKDSGCLQVPPTQRNTHLLNQCQPDDNGILQRIVTLVTQKTAKAQALVVDTWQLMMGFHCFNFNLQLDKWVHNFYFTGTIIDEITGEQMEYRDLTKRPGLRDTWYKSLANQVDCLTQGIHEVKGTDTMFFILKYEIPMDRRKLIIYGRIVEAYKPDKLKQVDILCQ